MLRGGRPFVLRLRDSEHTFEACCCRNTAASVAQWLRCCATNQNVAGRWFDPSWCHWNFSLA